MKEAAEENDKERKEEDLVVEKVVRQETFRAEAVKVAAGQRAQG